MMVRRLRTLGRGAAWFVLLGAVWSSLALHAEVISFGGLAHYLRSALAAGLPVPLYVGIILWLDRHEREPGPLLLAVFIWGAVIATGISALVNRTVINALAPVVGQGAAIVVMSVTSAPVIEEVAKGTALLLLFARVRREFDNVLDGLVYGALVGLGFAFVENVAYIARYSPQLLGGGIPGLVAIFFVREMAGFGHSLWTGITGASFGLARQASAWWVKLLAPIAGLVFAIALHALWNGAGPILEHLGLRASDTAQVFVVMPMQFIAMSLPIALTLAGITYLAWRQESRVITEQLHDEIATGVITPAEFAIVASGPARRRHLTLILRTKGIGAWLALRRLYDLQTELAFRKWHLRRGERMPVAQRATAEEAYREQISVLRRRLQAMEVTTG